MADKKTELSTSKYSLYWIDCDELNRLTPRADAELLRAMGFEPRSTNSTAQPLFSKHCKYCRRESVTSALLPQVKAVLEKITSEGRRSEFQGPGPPTSRMECRFGCKPQQALCCHILKFIDSLAMELVSTDHEFRLNGAGLKLISQGVTVGAEQLVTFSLRISPTDQAKDHPTFVEFANKLFIEYGLFNFRTQK